MALEGREKANILLDLLPYIYPKRKPTEVPAFSMSDHLASLSIAELANLRSEISRLMGEGILYKLKSDSVSFGFRFASHQRG